MKNFSSAGVAAREHDQLQIQAHHGVERVLEQVDAFLAGHPRHHPDYRPVFAGRQPEQIAQRARAFALAVGFRGRVSRGDFAIGGGIPLVIVGAVEDADEIFALVAQHSFEAEAEFRVA